jgi:hypothetical protein
MSEGRRYDRAMRLAVAALVLVACSKAPQAVAPPAPPAAPVALFHGRVRVAEDDARPVANARLRWILDRRPARTAEGALRLTGEGTTDANGRFALPRPPEGATGYASLWCELSDTWVLLEQGLQMPTQDVLADRGEDFAPEKRDSFVRMLVTGGGAPLAGARVELSLGADCAPIGAMRPVATTDAHGIVEIRGLDDSGEYWADVSADGFAPVRVATHQCYEGATASNHDEIDLPLARTLHCRVRADDGSTPPEAAVEVS